MAKFASYDFSFKIWQRSYAFTLIAQAIKLIFTGECKIIINMSKPRDIAMMEAGNAAAEEFDRKELES